MEYSEEIGSLYQRNGLSSFYPEIEEEEKVVVSACYARTPLHDKVHFNEISQISEDDLRDWINTPDRGGATPVFYASSPEMITYLVDRGANLTLKDQYDRNLWHYLALAHESEVFDAAALDTIKGTINDADKLSLAPMHYAFAYCTTTIGALIARKANVEQCDRYGRTPLLLAGVTYAQSGDLPLEYGPNVTARSMAGHSVIDYAVWSFKDCHKDAARHLLRNLLAICEEKEINIQNSALQTLIDLQKEQFPSLCLR